MKSKCYGRADPSSPREREIDGREPMTLADINRLINSKYEANLRRNMSPTKGFHHRIQGKCALVSSPNENAHMLNGNNIVIC